MHISRLFYITVGIILGLVASGKVPLISVVVRINTRDTDYKLFTDPTYLATAGYTTENASSTRSALSINDA